MVSQSSSVGYTIMGKTADLTVVQKTTIDTLHKEGKTQKVIAKEAGCSQSSVSKHINREAKGRKRCGRKKCTSNRDNCTLERIVKQNPFKNVGEIHKEWTAAGVSASRTTTHRHMQDMGFSCRIPCVKPLLNNRQRQKRLAWAKEKKDWTAAEWSNVMFSDESTFSISFGNQGPRVWRKRGEAQNPRCLRSSVKFPQSVMVWGAMSSAGVGPLCFLRSKVNTAVYQNILEHFMLPAADQLYGDADFSRGVSPEVHDHLHSFEHVKFQVVKTVPDRELLNLLSVSRLVTVLDEADQCRIVCKLQELDRGDFGCAVVPVERKEQWEETTALRSSCADRTGIGWEFSQPH